MNKENPRWPAAAMFIGRIGIFSALEQLDIEGNILIKCHSNLRRCDNKDNPRYSRRRPCLSTNWNFI